MNNKMNELSLKEKACKSLLANVLDMDDDLRWGKLINKHFKPSFTETQYMGKP